MIILAWRYYYRNTAPMKLVFNVCGNTYRLIVAMHFDRQMAYTLRFPTHAQYSADRWKDEA